MLDPTTGGDRIGADPDALRRLHTAGLELADDLDVVAARTDGALRDLLAQAPSAVPLALPGGEAPVHALSGALRRVDGALAVYVARLLDADTPPTLPAVGLGDLAVALAGGGLACPAAAPPARQVTVPGPHARTGTASIGDPVDTATGALWRREIDLVVPTPAGRLALARTYHSGGTACGWFGRGWASLLDVRLELAGDRATLTAEDGARLTFVHEAGGWRAGPGVATTLGADGDGQLVARRGDGTRYRFDAAGWLVARGAPGRPELTVRRARDGAPRHVAVGGRQVLGLSATGGLVRHVAGGAASASYRYDDDRLVAATGPRGRIDYGYEAGRLATVQRDGVPVLATRYDAAGRVAGQVDAAGGRWRFAYDGDGCAVVDPAGRTWVDTYRDGRLVARTPPDGPRVRVARDRDLHLVGTAVGDRDLTIRRTGDGTVVHGDGRPLWVATADRDRTRVAGPHARLDVAWDDAGRPVAVHGRGRLDLGHGPVGTAWIRDDRGRRMDLQRDDLGRPVRARGPAADVAFAYTGDDPGPDLVAVTGAAGTLQVARSRGVRGHRVEVTGPDGAVAVLGVDPHGRIDAATTAGGRRWTWDRDAAGRCRAVAAPGGVVTRWEHAPGQVVRSGPDGTSTLRLDAHGRLTCGRLADGREIALVRDRRGRIVSADLGAGAVAVTWEAAAPVALAGGGVDARLELDHDGRPVAVQDTAGCARIERDDEGRPVAVARTGLDPVQIAWEGDVPAAVTVGGTRADLPAAGHRWSGPGGPITRDARPDGVWIGLADAATVIDRYAGGRLVERTVTTAAGVVLHERLERDPDRRLARWTVDGLEQRLARDERGALAEVTAGGGSGLTYRTDAAGRRRWWTAPDGRRHRAVHDDHGRLVAVDGGRRRRVLDHDRGGRVVRDGSWRFAYDAAGGLRRATAPGWRIRHDLDVAGRRVRTRIERGGRLVRDLRWVWDPTTPAPRLLAVRDHVTGRRQIVRYGPGGTPAALVDPDDAAATCWLVTDHLGSVRVVLDAAGRPRRRRAYGPFGEVLRDTAPDPLAADAPLVDFGWLGAPTDPGTGHLHLGMRQYDPGLGRFCSPDPMQPPIGVPALDPWVYARNDPATFVDRDGCWPAFVESAVSGVAGAVGGVADAAGRVVGRVDDWWDRHEDVIGAVAMGVGIVGMVAATVATGGVAAPALAGAMAATATTATAVSTAVGLAAAVDGYTEGDLLDGTANLVGVALPFARPVGASLRAGTGLLHGLRGVATQAVAAEVAATAAPLAGELLDPRALAQLEALGIGHAQLGLGAITTFGSPPVDCT